MNKVMGAALAALMGMTAANVALASTAQCVNCTDDQIHNLARTLGASSSAHIVWDPATGNIKRFLNYCGSVNAVDPETKAGGTKAGCNLQSEELPVDADLAAVADAMSTVWSHTNGTFKGDFASNIGGIVYPSYLPGKPTAHDFLMDLGLRANIQDLVSTPEIFSTPGTGTSSTLGHALSFIAAHLDAFLAMKQGVYLTIDVQFHDGSQVSFLATLGQVPQYVAGSARDSSGHGLPDPAFGGSPVYPGRWYFGPGDDHNMAEFIEYMRSLGVTITSGTVPNGQVNCVWQPSTNTTTCFIPH